MTILYIGEPLFSLWGLRPHLCNLIKRNEYEDLIQVYDWLTSTFEVDHDLWYDWISVSDQLFQESAKYGSMDCMLLLHQWNPQLPDALSEAMIRVCELMNDPTTDRWKTASYELSWNQGKRKHDNQVKMLKWLVSRGGQWTYQRVVNEKTSDLLKQPEFGCASECILWYQNSVLLLVCSLKETPYTTNALELTREDIDFWIEMLLCNQEVPYGGTLPFPDAEYVGITLSNLIPEELCYYAMLQCCKCQEHFLAKMMYASLPKTYHRPQTWSWMHQSSESYLLRQWIVDTAQISHQELEQYVLAYPMSQKRKRHE